MLFTRIPGLVAREETLIEKAVATAYLCSYLADHVVLAMIEAERHVSHREMTNAEEQVAWNQSYEQVVQRVVASLEDSEQILVEIDKLNRYTYLPISVHCYRGRHWAAIEQVLVVAAARSLGHDAENYLRNKLMGCLSSRRSPRAKARLVCLIISMMSDAESWNNRAPWPGEYARLMIDLYPELAKHPAVLAEIVAIR